MLVLSSRYAREMEAVVASAPELFAEAGAGVQVVRKVEQALASFARDTALRLAVVDGRGALVAGLGATRELALHIEQRRGALLVLLSKSDVEAEAAVTMAGATHLLTSPFSTAQLLAAVRLCQISIARLDDAASGRAVDGGAARRDELTGLASSSHVHGWVELILGAPSGHDPLAILMVVAIGRFGQINAAYGRAVADALLQGVAQRLRLCTEAVSEAAGGIEPHMVARLAGAEFALVLPGPVRLADASQLAQQITAALEPAFQIDQHTVHLGCRIGIAVADLNLSQPEVTVGAANPDPAGTLFRQASAALLMAHAREPGSIEVFQATLDGEPMMRMAGLEADLRRALDASELEILFQPQVEISSGRIVGAEALVRWRHPVLGQLSAETLLEVAESAELAVLLGDRIRELALSVAAEPRPELAGLRLSINATAADLAAMGFAEQIVDALARHDFPAQQLMIEVTEGDLIANLEIAAATLERLRAHGIRIALDDFGTGYSSLAYLRALPLDFVKIDKRLVADFAGDSRDRIVVQSIIDMAHGLDMCVMAEGIENSTQLAKAAVAQCDWYQGFHCAPAMTVDELAAFVSSWNADCGATVLAMRKTS
ncbi:MAG: putative bifunctional diguanylate cyclase/phosphodiesterase [Polymorphobacter sp.]